jgi:uroporphyrinogen decarboxylase
MTGRERILTALRRGQPDVVPTFEWFIDAAVGRALTGCDDPIDVVDRLDLDGINIRADYHSEWIDDVTLTDEWGARRKYTGDVLPAVLASPIADITRHADYRLPDPEAPHRFATLQRAVEQLGDRRAVVLNLRDGFSDMRDLLGYENALTAMLVEPEAFDDLLRRVVDYNLRLAEIARERFGVEVIATTDDVANADGLLMRPATYAERLAPTFERVIRGYKSLGYLCIKHCDGKIDDVLDGWLDAGIDALDPIDPAAGYSLGAMKRRIGDRVCLKGNVDCTGALCTGLPEQVEQEVRDCLDQAAPGDGLILSSSNTIHRGVKPENYRAMLDALRRHGSQ